jgi:hypothetical protein
MCHICIFESLYDIYICMLHMKVAYQEQKEPEVFFVSYAWEVAYTHSSDLLWHYNYKIN